MELVDQAIRVEYIDHELPTVFEKLKLPVPERIPCLSAGDYDRSLSGPTMMHKPSNTLVNCIARRLNDLVTSSDGPTIRLIMM